MGHLISFAKHPDDLQTLLSWLQNGMVLDGLRLSYYNKWAIVKQAFQSVDLSPEAKRELLNRQMASDSSDNAQQEKLYCETLLREEYESLWKLFLCPDNLPQQHQTIRMQAFNTKGDLASFHPQFFAVVQDIQK